MDDQSKFVRVIASRLDAAGIPYMLTGSVAMAVYCEPRMTRDIDLVAELDESNGEKLIELFKGDCYVDSDAVKDAIKRTSMFNIISKEWTAKADFIVRKKEEYRRTEFGRRRKITIDQTGVWVVSIEDLILSKLVWCKTSRSDLQLTDVHRLVSSGWQLDWEYMLTWAAELGVRVILDTVRNNA